MTGHRADGTLFTYEVGNPANNEIKQPGKDTDYRAQGPTTYEFSPDERHGVPGGGGDPANETQNVPPASSRVIPDAMKEELYDNLTYINASRVASRYHVKQLMSKTAATFNDLFTNTEAIVVQRSGPMGVKPFRFMPAKGFWSFRITGSSGHLYIVRLKGVRKGNVKQLSKAQIKVSCSCPYWRWQGPEHWAKQNGYLYGRPRGTASTPVIRDPASTHWMCKHVAAVLNKARKYRFSAQHEAWFHDPVFIPEGAFPDPQRVVAMWRVK